MEVDNRQAMGAKKMRQRGTPLPEDFLLRALPRLSQAQESSSEWRIHFTAPQVSKALRFRLTLGTDQIPTVRGIQSEDFEKGELNIF